MTSWDYMEKLKDPRWQKKRLEIFQRDGFKCRLCKRSDHQLHVHHSKYGNNPWDGDDADKMTLCASCHAAMHLFKKIDSLCREFVSEAEDDLESIVRLRVLGNFLGGWGKYLHECADDAEKEAKDQMAVQKLEEDIEKMAADPDSSNGTAGI